MLLLYAVAIGVVLGLASGGKFAALGATTVRLWPVALLGLVGQVVLFSTPVAGMVGAWGPSLYVVSTTLVLMALVVNLRQPGFWDVNLSFRKGFNVAGTQHFDFRIEVFNIFNRTRLGNAVTNPTLPDFGNIVSRVGNRTVQLGLQYVF